MSLNKPTHLLCEVPVAQRFMLRKKIQVIPGQKENTFQVINVRVPCFIPDPENVKHHPIWLGLILRSKSYRSLKYFSLFCL